MNQLKDGQISTAGEIRRFAEFSQKRLNTDRYSCENMIQHSDYSWPGDFEGRTLLAKVSLARTLGISASYLQKLFKNQFDTTVNDYLNEYRIQKTCYLILHSPMTLKMIQEQVGFSSRQHFNYTFRKFTKLTPTEYKKKYLFSELKKKKEGVDTEFIEHRLEHPNYI